MHYTVQVFSSIESSIVHALAGAKCFSDLLGIYVGLLRSYSSEMLPLGEGEKGENLANILTTQYISAFCSMFRYWYQHCCQLCYNGELIT